MRISLFFSYFLRSGREFYINNIWSSRGIDSAAFDIIMYHFSHYSFRNTALVEIAIGIYRGNKSITTYMNAKNTFIQRTSGSFGGKIRGPRIFHQRHFHIAKRNPENYNHWGILGIPRFPNDYQIFPIR